MNIIFMGTPPFAATLLERIHQWTCSQPAGSARMSAVYCQPDRPAGRGHKLTPPAVKVQAQALGYAYDAIRQPLNFRDESDRAALAALSPDVLVVAAYGLILPQAVLDIPKLGAWNVHASLLPRHRGAAPIERALMAGETQTGVTIMRMEAGLDTGPMALQRALGIGLSDTAADLLHELAILGGDLLLDVLDDLRQGKQPNLIPQDSGRATYAAKLRREDGYIDFSASVLAVHAMIRGVTPRPGARTVLHTAGGSLEVLLSPGEFRRVTPAETRVVPNPGSDNAGFVLPLRKTPEGVRLPIVCGDGEYLLHELRPANRKAMSAEAFVNGYVPELRSGDPLAVGQAVIARAPEVDAEGAHAASAR